MKEISDFNKRALHITENVILLAITIATIAASVEEVVRMATQMSVHLSDLLLLFLYLEVLAMVGQFYESRKIPVRYPIYIGIMALARYLILDMKSMDNLQMLTVVGAIVLLAFSTLLMRYGQFKFPYPSVKRKDVEE